MVGATSNSTGGGVVPRLVHNGNTQRWVREPPGTVSKATAVLESVQPQLSPLTYFTATSPRQPSSKALHSLLSNMEHSATKAVSDELHTFEAIHRIESAASTDDQGPSSPRTGLAGNNGGLDGSAAPNTPDQPGLQPQESIPGNLVPVVSSNPITGLLCGVPLHRVFAAYKEQFIKNTRMHRASNAALQGGANTVAKREPLRITADDLLVMLKSLVPQTEISKKYARRILDPFGAPSPYGGSPKVFFVHVFSYLAKCYGHPVIEQNIRFLFKCLDPRNKGFIPLAVLTGRVIKAWSENRVMGGAVLRWRALSHALEVSGEFDTRLLATPTEVRRDELRVLIYTTQELTDALSQDLECELTTTPRFPTISKNNGDDTSSVASGRRRVF